MTDVNKPLVHGAAGTDPHGEQPAGVPNPLKHESLVHGKPGEASAHEPAAEEKPKAAEGEGEEKAGE